LKEHIENLKNGCRIELERNEKESFNHQKKRKKMAE
jgi:hypothetical protein